MTAIDQLTVSEAEELGLLVRRTSLALRSVTGCSKTYVMQFAEADGFEHLHVHVVPRMPDFGGEVLGPRVFAFLSDDETTWIPRSQRDALAMDIRAALALVH